MSSVAAAEVPAKQDQAGNKNQQQKMKKRNKKKSNKQRKEEEAKRKAVSLKIEHVISSERPDIF